jgi:hypothetical protein
MDDLRTRALLVDFDPARTGVGVIGTVVSRAEIAETAARGEFPATLFLELDRAGMEDGAEVTAHARVAVDWDEDTLDQLLASTDDSDIALWFDERELARAFDESEVEAHGLRERAAVLAVAAAAAGAGATPALAMHGPGEGGSAPAATINVDPQASHGGPVVQPMGAERALQLDERLGSGTASALSVDPQAAHGGAVAQPSGAERGVLQDEQIAVTQTGGSSSGSTTAASSSGPSSGELAAIAGLGAVLISAAGFGVARKRTPPAQPA